VIAVIVLGVAFLIAVLEAGLLAAQVHDLRAQRDRAVRDRKQSARSFAVTKLLEVEHGLRAMATEQFLVYGPNNDRGAAIWDAASWVADTKIPEVAAQMEPR